MKGAEFGFEAVLPDGPPKVVWTPTAVAGLVGQSVAVGGHPGRVTGAWLDQQGHVHVRLEVR